MIHVCFCFHDKTGHYAKFAGTAMLSIFENSSAPPQSTCVHILHDNTLTQDNRDKFIYVAGCYNQLVKFYNVEELCPEKIAEMIKLVPAVEKSRVSIGGFYRFLTPELFSRDIEKLIYFDVDIIVNLDIVEFWKIDISDKVLGVVTELENGTVSDMAFLLCQDGIVKSEDYFNSGVLLMNLKILREEKETIMQGLKFRGENPQQRYWDQTILNYCFSTRTLKLPVKFNRLVKNARRFKELTLERKIYHYAGGFLSLKLKMNDAYNLLWMNYFIKSPWFDAQAVGRLYEALLKIRNDLKAGMAKTSAIVSGKARAFFVAPKKIDAMKKFFSIRDDELIISAENEDSLQKLLDTMKTSQDKCVFFIMTEKFLNKNFPLDLLTKEGFVLNKDFLKGWEYLSGDYGNPLNSYKLIQVM